MRQPTIVFLVNGDRQPEAMACGLPVVESRKGGASELIDRGVNGLLLDRAASVPELAGHMESLAQSRSFASRLGCAPLKTVEPMSWDDVARQTIQVYQRALRN